MDFILLFALLIEGEVFFEAVEVELAGTEPVIVVGTIGRSGCWTGAEYHRTVFDIVNTTCRFLIYFLHDAILLFDYNLFTIINI